MGAGGGLWYVQHLKSENEILTLNNAKLNDAVDQQQAVIEQQLKDIEQIQTIKKTMENCMEFKVPSKVDVSTGDDFGQAS